MNLGAKDGGGCGVINTHNSVLHVTIARLCYLAETLWPAWNLISVAAPSYVPHVFLTTNKKTVKMSVEKPHFVRVSCLFFDAGDLFGLQAVKTVLTQHS